MVGTTGNAGNVAAISAMVVTIGGIVGRRAIAEANGSLAERGLLTETPVPNYGYVRSSAILRERMGFDLYNDWEGGNLDELTYTDRQGGNDSSGSFICQLQWRSCRYHMRYT